MLQNLYANCFRFSILNSDGLFTPAKTFGEIICKVGTVIGKLAKNKDTFEVLENV
jgi:hypothetical protein